MDSGLSTVRNLLYIVLVLALLSVFAEHLRRHATRPEQRRAGALGHAFAEADDGERRRTSPSSCRRKWICSIRTPRVSTRN